MSRGEAFLLHGWQLPDGHPAWLVRGMNAHLVLTEPDVLIPTRNGFLVTGSERVFVVPAPLVVLTLLAFWRRLPAES